MKKIPIGAITGVITAIAILLVGAMQTQVVATAAQDKDVAVTASTAQIAPVIAITAAEKTMGATKITAVVADTKSVAQGQITAVQHDAKFIGTGAQHCTATAQVQSQSAMSQTTSDAAFTLHEGGLNVVFHTAQIIAIV